MSKVLSSDDINDSSAVVAKTCCNDLLLIESNFCDIVGQTILKTIINFTKPLTSTTLQHIAYFTAFQCSGSRSSVAGATFMNEFAPYATQAPPLMRRTRQRFTGIYYRW